MHVYLDLDGVLANFDAHHESVFGVRPDRVLDNVDWDKVRAHKDFYLHIPPMPDMRELWEFVAPFNPTVLTGIPSSVAEAPLNKMSWVAHHIGPHVDVICCPPRHKCRFAKPGDVLIDDYEKYKQLWLDAGGRWITHRSAAESISELRQLMEEQNAVR